MKAPISQAVIMVGGKGLRLRPLTNHRPKPLLPVLGLPCVEYIIRSLVSSGVQEIIMACGYRSEDMLRSIGDGKRFGISIEYSYEVEPAGTAGSVKLLENRLHDTFIVASGDVLADVDIGKMSHTHILGGAIATMALTTVDKPTEFGIVGLNEEGHIERFLEKPTSEEVFSNLINAGIYILDKDALDYIPDNQIYDFSRNLFPDLMAKGLRIQGHTLNGYWKDIGRPEDLLQANLDMAILYRNQDWRSESVLTGSQVDEISAIMPRCHIQGSQIKLSVIEGDVRILDSQVRQSLLLSGSTVGHNSCITDSIIGYNCHIGESVRISKSVIADGITVPNGEEIVSCRLEVKDE